MFYLFLLFCNFVLLVFVYNEDTTSGGYLQGLSTGLALFSSIIFWVAIGIAKLF